MPKTATEKPWVSAVQAAAILGVEPRTFRKVMTQKPKVRILCLPGMKPRYSSDDLRRLARDSVRSAASA